MMTALKLAAATGCALAASIALAVSGWAAPWLF